MKFTIRPATVYDVDEIAEVHLDSIYTIGKHYYSPEIVKDWGAEINRQLYLNAMKQGEVFFIAIGEKNKVLGFSSHRIDDGIHGVSVYVRGNVARHGIGSALLREAEESAVKANADSIDIAASLAAVDFYAMNGFNEISRGEHQLASDRSMPCVYMQKDLRSL